jgi:AcrR family transcriptional regulator
MNVHSTKRKAKKMPRTKEQFEEMRNKSRNNIIETALKLFSANGYHSTSISAIAKDAGVAVGLMYNYFGSKEELLVSIMDENLQQLSGLIMDKLDGKHLPQDIRSIIDATIEAINEKRESWRLLISIMFQPDVSKMCIEQIDSFSIHQKDIYEQYYKWRGVDNPEESARVISVVLHGAFFKFASSGNLEEILLLRRTVIENLIENGLK